MEQRLNENNAPTNGSKKSNKKSSARKQSKETTSSNKKKQKKSSKSKTSKAAAAAAAAPAANNNDDHEKLNQFTHVQFQFDDYSPPPSSSLDAAQQDARNAAAAVEDALVSDRISPLPDDDDMTSLLHLKITEANDLNGNYDQLPLIRCYDDNQNTLMSRSSESIPFIDDGESHASRSPRFESRIITLIPKNVAESHCFMAAHPRMQSFLPKYQESPPKPPRAAQLRILPKIDEQKDETHKFQFYYNPGYKVCQICHLFLHVCPAIKCFECEFVCHQQCFDKVRVAPKFLRVFYCSSFRYKFPP